MTSEEHYMTSEEHYMTSDLMFHIDIMYNDIKNTYNHLVSILAFEYIHKDNIFCSRRIRAMFRYLLSLNIDYGIYFIIKFKKLYKDVPRGHYYRLSLYENSLVSINKLQQRIDNITWSFKLKYRLTIGSIKGFNEFENVFENFLL